MFRMFKMWGVVSAVLMLGAILGLGPALAASAQSSYFTQIAQAYKGKGVYVWSDGDRPDAFTAVEQDRFDSRIKQLTASASPVETTTTGLRQPVKLWQVLLIGGVCLAILIGVIVWANHFRSKRE